MGLRQQPSTLVIGQRVGKPGEPPSGKLQLSVESIDQCSLNRGYRITTWLWGRLVWRRRDGGRGRNMDCSQQTETSAATPSSPPAARHALFVTVLGLGGRVDRQSGRRKAEPSSSVSMIQSRPDVEPIMDGLPPRPSKRLSKRTMACVPAPFCLLCA